MARAQMMLAEPAVVITAFRPGASLTKLVSSLAGTHSITIVDDGSGAHADDVLAMAEALGAVVIRQRENRGIGAALNAGVTRAFAAGARFVATFDQDSFPESKTLTELVSAAEKLIARGERIAAVVPREFSTVSQASASAEHSDAHHVIQSGMVIPAQAFADLGEFDADLFIDLVDTEWELRAVSRGYRIVSAPTRIEHELGSMTRLLPFGKRLSVIGVSTMVSTPFRYYYRARNRILLTRKFITRMPVRMLKDALIETAYFAVVALAARPRRIMLRVLCRGISDGVRGKTGRMPDALATQAASITWSAAAHGDDR